MRFPRFSRLALASTAAALGLWLGGGCATGVTLQGIGGADGVGGDTTSSSSSSSSSTSTTSTSSSSSSSSSGVPTTCVMKQDCAALADACNAGNCVNGMCEKAPANDGSQCDDGLFCTDNDACQSGTCVGGTQKFCPSPDSCHVGACDEGNKACGSAPGNDGASCDDGDPCTYSGICSSGVCSKGSPVDCSAFNGVCSDGVCDPVLGCQAKPKNDGAPCDDGLYCTVADVCKAGACGGVPNTCAPPGDICMIGQCNEAQKTCVAVPGNNGSPCSDGNPCHVNATCSAGSCSGGVPGNAGAACDDGNPCTTGTKCTNGACGGATMTINQCVNADTCCPAMCTVANDNDCVPPLLAKPAYDAAVTFQDAAVLIDTHMTITFDGTNYWSVSGGSPGLTLAKYSAAGALLGSFMGLDFRSIFTVGGNSAQIFVRAYGDDVIKTMPSPGTYLAGTTLSGGTLDGQSSVVWNPAGTEYVATNAGSLERWSAAGSHIQTLPLVGFGTGDPNEDMYPQNRGVIAVGPYYLTYVNQKLSAWNASGMRVKTVTLNGAGTSFDSHFSLSWANSMVFIVDSAGGTWRGYNIGG